MKKFLSNSWVVSIISGIIVFLFTNAIIMLQNKRKHKKQIKEANLMVLNRIRGYVVDNGLPKKEIINSVRSSTAREYNIKCDELLNIKELCEELITNIIGNIYISNDNKVKYIDMLRIYLNENNSEEYNLDNNNPKNIEIKTETGSKIPIILAILAGLISSYNVDDINIEQYNVYIILIKIAILIMLYILSVFILKITKELVRKIMQIKNRK